MSIEMSNLTEVLRRIRDEVGKVIIGQQDVIDTSLIAILTRQHVLVEGVPGIAKTLLVRALACALGSESSRIQFTPDLMPADIVGTNVFNMQRNEFTLVKGPVFTTFLLADEINRAPAKTQSALLQAMQERRVSIDRETHALSPNFTVFATQNPVEYEGTYPLPEAQKDRFMMKIIMDYPEKEAEVLLAQRMLTPDSPEAVLERGDVHAVIAEQEIAALRHLLEQVVVREEIVTYIVDIVRATRTSDAILLGAGPRATQSFILASRVRAALEGRDYVTPDDIKGLAVSILAHRLILRPEHEMEGLTVQETVEQILQEVSVPR